MRLRDLFQRAAEGVEVGSGGATLPRPRFDAVVTRARQLDPGQLL